MSHPDIFDSSVVFEVLNLTFALPCLFDRGKRTQVASLSGSGVFPAGVNAIFTGFEFANHGPCDAPVVYRVAR
jgi:hypothetical protein